ncbi:MAG: hypothetical protein CMB80_01715 [Flammeovirgaceae bacterium]|nr:hypothetical protein [Flammeovirgaceae bacterium]
MTVYAVCRTGKGANTFVAHPDVKAARSSGNGFNVVGTKKDLSDKRSFPTSFLVDIYNKNALRKITKFRDRATAEKKVFELLSQQQVEEHVEKNNKVPTDKKRVFNGKVIRATTRGKNPRREGTHAFDSMQILLDKGPMKYEDFITAGGRRPDFYYDLKHGWVNCSD